MPAPGLLGDGWYQWPIWSYYEGQFVSVDYCEIFSAGEPGHYDWQMERRGWCSRIIFMKLCMCMHIMQKGNPFFTHQLEDIWSSSQVLSLSLHIQIPIYTERKWPLVARGTSSRIYLEPELHLLSVHSEETQQNSALEWNHKRITAAQHKLLKYCSDSSRCNMTILLKPVLLLPIIVGNIDRLT